MIFMNYSVKFIPLSVHLLLLGQYVIVIPFSFEGEWIAGEQWVELFVGEGLVIMKTVEVSYHDLPDEIRISEEQNWCTI